MPVVPSDPKMRQYRLSKRLVDSVWNLWVKVRYPKIAALILVVIFAYLIFRLEGVQSFFNGLGDIGYVSVFCGGMLFAFGWGAPFGVAILATVAENVNVLVAGIIGGFGALLSDYLLFKFIRLTFNDEIQRFRNSRAFTFIDGVLLHRFPPKLIRYLSWGFAGFVIASPLPDEIGVSILASIATVDEKTFAVVSYVLNTLGILAVLAAGSVV